MSAETDFFSETETRPAVVSRFESRRDHQPGATYRLQLHEQFGFAAVIDQLDYLARLHITHLYLSPILQARAGSTHGYDVVDPGTVSLALGGESGLRELAAAAAERGLGLIVDVVPNHLAVSIQNALWERLLSEGMSGPAGSVFDVDWRPPLPTAEGKVILPVLADPYGVALAAGDLQLARIGGLYRLRYREQTFPLRRETLDIIDDAGGGKAFSGTPGLPGSWQPLHEMLEQQHYRVVHRRIGDQVINYRRFLAINDLAAVRIEVPEVFDLLHAKILSLVADGVISGLRVDHPDGLRDPERYLQHLANRTGVWIVAEKILHPDERLPPWPVAGTTGYDFINEVLGLYINPEATPVLTEIDHRMGGGTSYAEHAVNGKREVLETGLCADLERLALRLWTVSQQRPQVRDVTLDWCRRALARTLEHFGVYRTYVDPETGAASETDRGSIAKAIARAREADNHPPAELWDFLAEVLSGDVGTSPALLDVAARFQQLCSAVTAKGTEDTAFYRYRPLLATNEVGADPPDGARSVEQFQQANVHRSERHPLTLLSTATHDTKRGEDTRLRIAALSELPEAWRSAVAACEEMAVRSPLPAQSRQLVYQSSVGIWPLQGDPDDGHRDRLAEYVVKAEREAGLFTSWREPDEQFEERLRSFARTMLVADDAPEALITAVQRAAEIAMVSGLGQVVLRSLSPGVADCYQGTEVWDDALVDPDNRRAVPFSERRALLDGLADASVDELLARRRDGRIKMFVLQQALRARAAHPSCCQTSSGYLPLQVSGTWSEHIVGFARVAPDGSDALLVVAPRLPGAVMGDQADPPLAEAWGDTTLRVPAFLQGEYRDVFSSGAGEIGDQLSVAAVLTILPVAVLERA